MASALPTAMADQAGAGVAPARVTAPATVATVGPTSLPHTVATATVAARPATAQVAVSTAVSGAVGTATPVATPAASGAAPVPAAVGVPAWQQRIGDCLRHGLAHNTPSAAAAAWEPLESVPRLFLSDHQLVDTVVGVRLRGVARMTLNNVKRKCPTPQLRTAAQCVRTIVDDVVCAHVLIELNRALQQQRLESVTQTDFMRFMAMLSVQAGTQGSVDDVIAFVASHSPPGAAVKTLSKDRFLQLLRALGSALPGAAADTDQAAWKRVRTMENAFMQRARDLFDVGMSGLSVHPWRAQHPARASVPVDHVVTVPHAFLVGARQRVQGEAPQAALPQALQSWAHQPSVPKLLATGFWHTDEATPVTAATCHMHCIGLADPKVYHPVVPYEADHQRPGDGVTAGFNKDGQPVQLMAVGDHWGSEVKALRKRVPLASTTVAEVVAFAVRQPYSGKDQRGKARAEVPSVGTHVAQYYGSMPEMTDMLHTWAYTLKPIPRTVRERTLRFPAESTYKSGTFTPRTLADAMRLRCAKGNTADGGSKQATPSMPSVSVEVAANLCRDRAATVVAHFSSQAQVELYTPASAAITVAPDVVDADVVSSDEDGDVHMAPLAGAGAGVGAGASAVVTAATVRVRRSAAADVNLAARRHACAQALDMNVHFLSAGQRSWESYNQATGHITGALAAAVGAAAARLGACNPGTPAAVEEFKRVCTLVVELSHPNSPKGKVDSAVSAADQRAMIDALGADGNVEAAWFIGLVESKKHQWLASSADAVAAVNAAKVGAPALGNGNVALPCLFGPPGSATGTGWVVCSMGDESFSQRVPSAANRCQLVHLAATFEAGAVLFVAGAAKVLVLSDAGVLGSHVQLLACVADFTVAWMYRGADARAPNYMPIHYAQMLESNLPLWWALRTHVLELGPIHPCTAMTPAPVVVHKHALGQGVGVGWHHVLAGAQQPRRGKHDKQGDGSAALRLVLGAVHNACQLYRLVQCEGQLADSKWPGLIKYRSQLTRATSFRDFAVRMGLHMLLHPNGESVGATATAAAPTGPRGGSRAATRVIGTGQLPAAVQISVSAAPSAAVQVTPASGGGAPAAGAGGAGAGSGDNTDAMVAFRERVLAARVGISRRTLLDSAEGRRYRADVSRAVRHTVLPVPKREGKGRRPRSFCVYCTKTISPPEPPAQAKPPGAVPPPAPTGAAAVSSTDPAAVAAAAAAQAAANVTVTSRRPAIDKKIQRQNKRRRVAADGHSTPKKTSYFCEDCGVYLHPQCAPLWHA